MIHRMIRDRENPWFQMNRNTARDSELSFKALGILTYLISRPDNWEFQVEDLVRSHLDGHDSIKSGLKELREAGYIEKVAIKDEKGRIIRWEAHIYEHRRQNVENQGPDVGEPRNRETQIVDEPRLSIREKKEGKKEGVVTRGVTLPRSNTGFILPGDDDTNKPDSPIMKWVRHLYDGLKENRKIIGVPNLGKWEQKVRNFILTEDFNGDDLRRLLEWYLKNMKEPFMPVVRTAEQFLDKIVAIEDAYERSLLDKNRNGQYQGEPVPEKQLVINTTETVSYDQWKNNRSPEDWD